MVISLGQIDFQLSCKNLYQSGEFLETFNVVIFESLSLRKVIIKSFYINHYMFVIKSIMIITKLYVRLLEELN